MTATATATATSSSRSLSTRQQPPKHQPLRARRGEPHFARGQAARHPKRAPLARYADAHGRPREVIVREGLAGSVLVVDRDALTHADCLLVAHLAADEPQANAGIVAASYLHDVRTRGLRCRSVTAADASTAPIAEIDTHEPAPGEFTGEVRDAEGSAYRLGAVPAGMSIPALRWCRTRPGAAATIAQPVSLRETIARLQSYEPMRTYTARALSYHRQDDTISIAILRAEMVRVGESPIVLNRRLREAVLARLKTDAMSMSEMALRCGRIKRDGKGNESGETSWLARRLGLLAESGQSAPTPWVHSDVLALIARRGLGMSPRELEL